ncbi:MAG TPA: hypothetical protein VN851_27075 [Thermoanaerobaculia bacterium]|nr:hypothetical protein [Thermoanaerobaculia bacterium]
MSLKIPRLTVALVLVFLALGLASPAWAELSTAQLNDKLIGARTGARDVLSGNLAELETKYGDEETFEDAKNDLAGAWEKDLDKTIEGVSKNLGQSRQEIADSLSGEPERLDKVSATLREKFQSVIDGLNEIKDGIGERLEDFDPDADDAQTVANERFKALAEALKTAFDSPWGALVESAGTSLASQTPNDKVTEAAKTVQKFINDTEKNYKRVVSCHFVAAVGTLTCDNALAVSGAEISTIEIDGLPNDKKVIVSARTAKDAPSGYIGGAVDPESDSITLPPGYADKVSIDVYLRRLVRNTYQQAADQFSKLPIAEVQGKAARNGVDCPDSGNADARVKAAWVFRCVPAATGARAGFTSGGQVDQGDPAIRTFLALIVSGRSPRIIVQVKVVEDEQTTQLVTTPINLGYSRWGVDTGGFFAVAGLADEEVITEPSEMGMVKVRKIRGARDYTQDTGILLTLVPRNYPVIGIGIGFSSNDEQANTFYVGPTLRFLTFENRAVASFSVGATMRSVKRFPGLPLDEPLAADDSRLEGKSQYKFGGYAMIQLGFAFGRIPGADSDAN